MTKKFTKQVFTSKSKIRNINHACYYELILATTQYAVLQVKKNPT